MPSSPWTEQRTVASDGTALAWFGSSVAMSDGWAIIGARNASVDGHSGQGAAYVFQRLTDRWAQAQKLTGKGSGAGDQFGLAIAMHGDLAMITAPYTTVDGGIWRGVVHVFRRNPAARQWNQTQLFHSDDVPIFGTLGTSVATNGEHAFVGAGGANHAGQYLPRKVYVFRHTDAATDTWTRVQVLDSPTPLDMTDAFGGALAVTDDTLVVGARATTLDGKPGQGMVYVYTRSGTQWQMSAKISAPDGQARDNFGVSIAIVGDRLFVGAQGAVSSSGGQGSVYLFHRTGSQWQFTQKLAATDPQGVALFGALVRAHGDRLLVGAYGEDNYCGAAYVFTRGSHGYVYSTRLTASDRVHGDVFAYYGDIADDCAALGAYTKTVDGKSQQGSAYFFKPPAATSRSK